MFSISETMASRDLFRRLFVALASLITLVLFAPARAVGQNFTFDLCNTGDETLHVAAVHRQLGRYVSEGWVEVRPEGCFDDLIIDEGQGNRYYLAFAMQFDQVGVRLLGGPRTDEGKTRRTDRRFCVKWPDTYRSTGTSLSAVSECDEGYDLIPFNVAVSHDGNRTNLTYRVRASRTSDWDFFPSDLYALGRRNEQDGQLDEAASDYERAAVLQHTPAQLALARLYENGRGVRQDYSEALRWYRAAAEQGDAAAQTAVGFFYYGGRSVPRHLEEAMRWYRRAAAQGHASAQFNLGQMYGAGDGVPRDYLEAVRWYRSAAEQDHGPALHSLGHLYEDGNGVARDLRRALEYYQRAAEAGVEEAAEDARRLQ